MGGSGSLRITCGDEALPPDDVRLPDERARLRADEGMLESLGYAEAAERGEADLILFNTCSIRETADSRFVAHLGEAKRLKRERARAGGRRRRLLGAVAQGGGVRALPVRRRRVRPGAGPQARRVPHERLADARRASSSSRASPAICRRGARGRSRAGCRSASAATARCSYCIVPSTRGREVSRPAGELVAEVRRDGRRRRPRGHAARAERQLLRPRSAAADAERASRSCSR